MWCSHNGVFKQGGGLGSVALGLGRF